jgi:hypothetical protein
MEKIGCSKQIIWGETVEKVTWCENCGHTYDSKCPCNGVEFIYPKCTWYRNKRNSDQIQDGHFSYSFYKSYNFKYCPYCRKEIVIEDAE